MAQRQRAPSAELLQRQLHALNNATPDDAAEDELTLLASRIEWVEDESARAPPQRSRLFARTLAESDVIEGYREWVVRYDSPPPERDLFLAAENNADWAEGEDGQHWLRFTPDESAFLAHLSREAFRVDKAGVLFRPHASLPVGHLPKLQWRPFVEQLQINLPIARFPEQIQHENVASPAFPLKLVSASQTPHRSPLPPAAILTSLDRLLAWADTAPQRRLSQLRWLCRGQDAFVAGASLPPVSGDYFSQQDRLFLPAGTWWAPDLNVQSLVRLLDQRVHAATSHVHLWMRDNSIESIHEDKFVTLSRASLRTAIAESNHH